MSNDPEYKRRWYLRNKERQLAAEAERYRTDPGFRERKKAVAKKWQKLNRDRYNKRLRERRKRPEISEKVRRYSRAYRVLRSERSFAHTCVGHAIRDGKLIRPSTCSACGSTRYVIAHHHDYTKPMEVTWLCRVCHHQIHHQPERATQ